MPYDDTVCVACSRRLVETPEPGTWQDHGFCGVGCAARVDHAFDVRGTDAVLELVRIGGGRGAGVEEALIRDWRRDLLAVPDGILWLAKRRGADDPHVPQTWACWSWRVYLTNACGSVPPRCVAFRLSAREDGDV